MVGQGIPHLTKSDAQIIATATKPSGAAARQLPAWLVISLLLAAPAVWIVFFLNLEAIDRGFSATALKSLSNRLLPLVEFVRLYQWRIATLLLVLLAWGQQLMLQKRETLIAKLYWHLKKLAPESEIESVKTDRQ